MALELVTLPCLEDNYAFLLHDSASGETAAIDVPEAAPIAAALEARGWTLSDVWLTHHHWDHVDGLANLLAAHPARVTGAGADAHRLPSLDRAVAPGETFSLAGQPVTVIDVSGHTVGHVAYHVSVSGHVFTGDSLMALGCGRLFEGTPAQMHASLTGLATLPPQTIVCSGHEYTAANARFAETIEPDNPALISRIHDIASARAAGAPTVPSTLEIELATNPFLRGHVPAVQARLGMTGADSTEVFAEIRARKDRF